MKNGRVRCGVIGAGWWATYAHLPALLRHPGAEVLAVQKRDLAAARRVADDFGVPYAFASAAELLAMDKLDAVVVSSSPAVHHEQARAALARGLHLAVEKPMTIRAAESRELVESARAAGRQLVISCPWHYTRHACQARALIAPGELGEIRMMSVLMANPVDHLIRGEHTGITTGTAYLSPSTATYADPAVAGGGQIYTQVSHAAAYLTFLTGLRPERVFARFHNDGARMDIYDALHVQLEGGAVVALASTGATPDPRRDYEVRVFGTRGLLFLDLWRGTMEWIPSRGAPVRYPGLAPRTPARDRWEQRWTSGGTATNLPRAAVFQKHQCVWNVPVPKTCLFGTPGGRKAAREFLRCSSAAYSNSGRHFFL